MSSHNSKTIDLDMSAVLEEEDSTDEFMDEEEEDDNVSFSSITPTIRRSKWLVALVLLVGIAGGIAFLILGIQKEKDQQDEHFELRATQLTKDLANTVQEYEVAARSVHNVCHNRKTTRAEFKTFFEYLTSGGLRFGAAQCLFNVTHEERPAYEAEAKTYYDENYPPNSVNYTGFKGFKGVVDPETGKVGVKFLMQAEEAPFYFPVHYSEPVIPNARALGLDTYSHPFQQYEIDMAIETRKPVLGTRLKVVQETQEGAFYSVIIRHPGIPQPNETEKLKEIAGILVRIPSLLERRAQEQKESIACFVYDMTPRPGSTGEPVYLGAAQFQAKLENGTVVTTVAFPPVEVDYQQVIQENNHHGRVQEVHIPIAHGTWKVVVTPLPGDDTFQVNTADTVFGGVMILLCTLFLAAFLWRNMRQMETIHEAKHKAQAERKIIAGLFPENVIERLVHDEKIKQQALKRRKKQQGQVFDGKMTMGVELMAATAPTVTTAGTADLMMDPMTLMMLQQEESTETNALSKSLYGSNPIADHFEDTTILFMDMVVETVGDCYVAVVGIPTPVKKHARVMSRFATDCLVKMKALLLDLAEGLGEDTKDLNLRVGLHSGSVTGGVLRGEKGRFQLFGDSMNTAARMEQNGQPGKIHVSASTAEALRASGCGKWLTERQDKIVAKGLGQLTTYWVYVNTDSIGTGFSGFTSLSEHTGTGHRETESSYNHESKELSTWEEKLHESQENLLEEASFADEYEEVAAEQQAPAPQSRLLLSQAQRAFGSFAERFGIQDEVEV
ncbi:natriuretic peptide receptor 2 [Seminavis robusta]|uniref:Natriuretic peptide receptor 2 n=1 Tax=Seminavis robusta TaxID=568900 RepID=A0A9N8HJ36_9STRA|nr:natriuretic peptide receptor 2 [Seminavis robusta]|eukprot:Sro738_g195290.1 natriuretic peptide receptor 2 (784) ;mRNA; r:18911-21789